MLALDLCSVYKNVSFCIGLHLNSEDLPHQGPALELRLLA